MRSLLAAVAFVAVFIAYHVNWIRERHLVFSDNGPKWYRIYNEDHIVYMLRPEVPHAPGLLWLFGERGRCECQLHFGDNVDSKSSYVERELTPVEVAEVNRIKRLFPEAIVGAGAFVLLDSP